MPSLPPFLKFAEPCCLLWRSDRPGTQNRFGSLIGSLHRAFECPEAASSQSVFRINREAAPALGQWERAGKLRSMRGKSRKTE